MFAKWLHYVLYCNLFSKRKKVLTIYLGSYDPFSDFDEKLNQEVGTLKQELGVTELGTYISLSTLLALNLSVLGISYEIISIKL